MIYLDNAATTQTDPEVLNAMIPYMREQYGNPGALYAFGREAKKAVENARFQVADFIGAEPDQIIFTSGGTESNNMVFFSLANYLKSQGKNHIITSAVEHDSVLKSVQAMCIKHGFYKSTAGVDKHGCVSPNQVKAQITENTGIVSVMYVNNETGSENDIESIARICREKNIMFHTDCVQAAGCCKLDVNKIGCDFLSLSSHKLHGTKGCGALFVRSKNLTPLIYGGVAQEFGLRGGTENVAAIVGFGKACELMKARIHEIDIQTSILKQVFYKELATALASKGLDSILNINGNLLIKHGKILNISLKGVDSETLLLMLDVKGVCVSSGSACRSHESEPSHVLIAMGVPPDIARNSIRISFSKYNTEDEIVKAAKIIADCVEVLYDGN